MNAQTQRLLSIPESIRRETGQFRQQVARFVRGEWSPTAFRAYRVPWGVYEQRATGHYMVRVRVGAGVASSAQLRRIARLSRRHGNGTVHVTTRQDMQIHDVAIENTPDVLEGLLEAGLSSRGGGGNTVRNITACPLAGLCEAERFDVTPYAIALAEYLLQFDSSYHLPRKYKIVFSGCPADCGLASVTDLGFFAQYRNGTRGFAVYAAGGLGPNPAIGIQVEEFIGEDEIFEVAEAVKRLFDRHGDRANKRRARLRYVLKRLGPEEFVRLYRNERAAVRQDGLETPIPPIATIEGHANEGAPSAVGPPDGAHATADALPEKGEGLYTFRLRLPLGDICADDLLDVARLAEDYGSGVVRTTQQQNLLIPSVPQAKLDGLRGEIGRLRMRMPGETLPEIVACAGASTCKLGLCLSRGLATAVAENLAASRSTDAGGATIRISGCPNSCAQHYVADIGLQGRARRIGDRRMPCYDVFAGGKAAEGAARLGELVGTVPARAVPDLLAELFATDSGNSQLKSLVRKYASATESAPDEYYYDWGADRPFSLAGRGPGECGAGVMDVIAADIEQAQEALKRASASRQEADSNRDLYEAVLASARALLVLSGVEPATDREVFQAFGRHLIEPGWVEPVTYEVLDHAVEWRMGDRKTLSDMRARIETLVRRIEDLFRSLDANLKFRLEPVAAAMATSKTPTSRLDLRGIACPLNFVKAKLAVEKIGIGDVLEIELDDGEPIRNVPGSLSAQGQEVLATEPVEDHFRLRVRRTK